MSSHIGLFIAGGGTKVGKAGKVVKGPTIPLVTEDLVCVAESAIDGWITVLAQGQGFWAEKLGGKRVWIILEDPCSENEGNNA